MASLEREGGRNHFRYSNIAIILFVVSWYVFGAGLLRSLRYIWQDRRKPVPYLAASQCALGLVSTLFYAIALLPGIQVPCLPILYTSHFSYLLSYLSILAILVMKAYCATRRHRLVLLGGAALLVLNCALLVYAAMVMQIGRTRYTCWANYGTYYTGLKLAADLVTHAFLSGSILAAAWAQLWNANAYLIYRLLLQDGIIYGISVCISSCACALIVFNDLMGNKTSIVYAVNWVLVSALIIHQLHAARERTVQSIYIAQPSSRSQTLCERTTQLMVDHPSAPSPLLPTDRTSYVDAPSVYSPARSFSIITSLTTSSVMVAACDYRPPDQEFHTISLS